MIYRCVCLNLTIIMIINAQQVKLCAHVKEKPNFKVPIYRRHFVKALDLYQMEWRRQLK